MRWTNFARGAAIYFCVLTVALMVGCASTPQGKDIDIANWKDMGSTGIVLGADALVDGAVQVAEANPFGVMLIPIKAGMGYVVEEMYSDNCVMLANFSQTTTVIYEGAAANNLTLAAAVIAESASIASFGLPVGIAWGAYRAFTYTPELCAPEDGAIRDYILAYNEGDAQTIDDLLPGDVLSEHQRVFDASPKAYMQAVYWNDNHTIVVAQEEYSFWGGFSVWRLDHDIQDGMIVAWNERELSCEEVNAIEGFDCDEEEL